MSICFVIGFVAISFSDLGSNSANASISSEIDKNMNALMKSIEEAKVNNPKLAMSSNPYKYIEDNIYFDNIVALGNKALPFLVQKIKSSEDNGLAEYILAIATEKIAKLDLKKNNFGWEEAKGFTEKWDSHLAEVPSAVKEIAHSTNPTAEKIRKLTELGTPAIPYILDTIEAGNPKLFPAVLELDDTLASSNIVDPIQWSKQNNERYTELRNLTN